MLDAFEQMMPASWSVPKNRFDAEEDNNDEKFLVFMALGSLLASASGCTSNPKSATIEAMNDPVNACGTGGSSDPDDCSSGRR